MAAVSKGGLLIRALTISALYTAAVPLVGTASVHSVFSYGAVGDGITNDTAAIQQTIEAAAADGPNSVVLLDRNGSFR